MKGFGERHQTPKKKANDNNQKTSDEKIINTALKLHSKGNFLEAKKYYESFINQGLKDERIFSNYGILLKDLGKLQEAELFTQKAIKVNPNFAMAYYNLGSIQKALRNLKGAEISIRKAIKINPNFAIAYSNLGNILKDLGKLQEAEIFHLKAIELNPNHPLAHLNLGYLLIELGKLKEAEISTRKAIELNPNFAGSHANLGVILRELGKLQEAEISTLKAIELNPNTPRVNETLGLILLEKKEYDLCLKYFSKSAVLLNHREEKETNKKRFSIISKAKIEHDIEQFEYLASKSDDSKKYINLVKQYKKIASEINWPSESSLINLNNTHQNLLRDSYNRLLNIIKAPRLKDGAINESLDTKRITDDYFNHEFGLTYIDNFLSKKALNSLRNFLYESTIWFDVKKDGYLGTYLINGLANPLIFQIADELRKKFPKIFKSYSINQIWAYKYDSRAKNKDSSLKGINVHADYAAVNVNFWITPKEANLNPKSGGLIVYDVEAPEDWDFNTYNNNEKRIREELKKSKGKTKVIKYNENRAVVFNSNLFHETDSYEFKEGYKNRRINVTILFGRREGSREGIALSKSM